jgi:hypothetical protein
MLTLIAIAPRLCSSPSGCLCGSRVIAPCDDYGHGGSARVIADALSRTEEAKALRE